MRLLRLQLANWRSFPTCDVNLDQAVTVLIGQNGTGKTALLNAFVWGLYGETTDGFSKPDDLCNHQARLALEPGETTQVEVTVTFHHSSGGDDYRYEARRSLDVTRTGPGKEDFTKCEPRFVLNRYPLGHGGDARTDRDDLAEREVRAILPAGLNPYFFFPAENIGASIDAPDARASSIREAVDVLLGLKWYEISRTTIERAFKLPQLKEKKSNDLTLTKAQERRDLAREKYEQVARRLSELPAEVRRVNALRDEAEADLDRIRGAEELRDRRRHIQSQYEDAERAAQEAEDQQRTVLNEECFNLFGANVLKQARVVLDLAQAEGRIPPKVSAGLLNQLIDHLEVCICGQPISDAERDTLRRLRATVVEDTVAESASSARARVIVRDDRLTGRADTETPHALLRAAETAIHDAHRHMKTWLDKREAFDEDNPTLRQAIGSNPLAVWQKYLRIGNDLEAEQKDLETQAETLARDKRDAENAYEKLHRSKGKADDVSNARRHLIHVERTIEDLQKLLRDRSRFDIERAINRIVHQIFLRDYEIHLTPQFALEVRQDDLSVGASSSERAWVTFAFVGALAGLIDVYNKDLERMDEAGNIELRAGTGYPLVLDAPFSPFGEEYATQFAERLPNLVPQSVIIIREDQVQHLAPIMISGVKVRAYLMCFHGPRSDVRQTIKWGDGNRWGDGIERVYVKPADDPARIRTEMVELPT